jgi:hypothetical protein
LVVWLFGCLVVWCFQEGLYCGGLTLTVLKIRSSKKFQIFTSGPGLFPKGMGNTGMVKFQFEAPVGIKLSDANWTDKSKPPKSLGNAMGDITGIPEAHATPEKASTFLLFGLGLLGLAGTWTRIHWPRPNQ